MLFCPPMANPPPSLSWAVLLEITESGAHISNPFTDHHLPPCAASKPELPPLQTLPLMVGECVLGEPCTKMPLPDPDLLTWLPAMRPSFPANVIPTPSQTLSMTRPWLDQTPALAAVTRIAPVGGLAPGTVLVIWFLSIDQLLPPKAAIPHFPLLTTAQV